MKIRQRRSVDRAAAVVITFVKEKKLRPGYEIPPAKELALVAGVSFVTMLRALNQLRRNGILSGVPGHPFKVADAILGTNFFASQPDAGRSRAPAPQLIAWRRTRERIICDLLAGAFPPGSDLPSAKELRNRYGVSQPSLRKAIDSLVADGIVEPRKKGFHVPAFTAPGYHSRIILLTHSFDSYTMYLGQHNEELIKSLERMCAQAQIALDVYLIFPESLKPKFEPHPQLLRERRTGKELEFEAIALIDDQVVFGYILVVPGPPGGTENRLLPILHRTKKPAAVLAEAGGWSLAVEYARSGRIQLFTIASSPEPARSIGRYLLALGHRRLAFLSPYHQYLWSQARLHGLNATLTPLGSGCVISAYVAENELQGAVLPGEIAAFFASFNATLTPPGRMEYEEAFDRIRQDVARRARTREVLHGLLDQAFADSVVNGITAWVAVNDETACMTLKYLAAKGVSVPRDLSVVSFDDSRDALRMNLTSYNFNASGTAAAMLGYILNRRPFVDAARTGTLEIEGYIAERQTVAAALGQMKGL